MEFAAAKPCAYFGCKFHTVVSLAGLILGFVLTRASHYDNQPVVQLLDSFSHHLSYGDRRAVLGCDAPFLAGIVEPLPRLDHGSVGCPTILIVKRPAND